MQLGFWSIEYALMTSIIETTNVEKGIDYKLRLADKKKCYSRIISEKLRVS